ncbi:hypothetical protein HOD75_01840 [archaeon]|jgi:hypothetical protein|nr:hypothetical protein [archaeon]MBT4241619.1 hypothetical protein [archaeon]MBT4418014.1 hypothetical protein [archaeon]
MKGRRGQISFEYLVIMGFVMFVIISILGVAFIYSGSIKDRIKVTQVNNCANKVISSAESIFYTGFPSRTVIDCYLPENLLDIEILENRLFVSVQTSTGIVKTGFSSDVPITGDITSGSGIKRIRVIAQENNVLLSDY